MNISPVAIETAAAKGITHCVTLEWTDFNATAALTKTLELFPATAIKAGTEVSVRAFYIETAFAGCATLSMQVGDGVDPDRYCTAAIADLKTAGYTSVLPTVATQPFTYKTAADGVDVLLTATTDNLTALSAGKVHVWFSIVDLTAEVP